MSTAPPPAGQAGTGAPPPPVVGGTTVFVPPLNPMATSKAIEASASPEVLAWLKAAWNEWDVRPQVAVALVYRACQAAGFPPQPDNNFRGFTAWVPSSVGDAAQTHIITAAATPARQPASQQTTTVTPTWGSFPASLPGAAETTTSDASDTTDTDKAAKKAAKKAAVRAAKKAAKKARQRALLAGIAAAVAAALLGRDRLKEARTDLPEPQVRLREDVDAVKKAVASGLEKGGRQ